MKTNFKWSRSTSISFHNFRVHGQHALSYVPPLQGSHIKHLRRTQWVVYVWDRETEVRVGLPLRKGMSEGLKERERVPSLGAGRPMWLGLPLFVFPTQSDMTGAISTPSHSHSQGPLSTNLPLLMIHSSVKGTMFAYGTASCTWHHQNIFYMAAQNILVSPSFDSNSQSIKEVILLISVTFSGWWRSRDLLYFRVTTMP